MKPHEIIEAGKKLVDREIELYRKELEVQVNERILQLEATEKLGWANANVKVLEDWKKFEHDFHQGMEVRKVELAKLDAEITCKKQMIEELDKFISYERNMNDRLLNILESKVYKNMKP